jgi:segregation and condensation protein B
VVVAEHEDPEPDRPAGPSEPPAAAEAAPEAGEPAEAEGAGLPPEEVRAMVEALVFAAPSPVTPRELGRILGDVARADWTRALDELRAEYDRPGRGLQLVEVGGGFQITTRPEYNDRVRELVDPRSPARLSIQALETLAVIAYRQPVTLPEIIELRGIKSGGVVKTLLERRLVRITGRKEVVGRPLLYGTTREFLLQFGLKDLAELPRVEEFAEVLGEEVDVAGLKRALASPRPVEAPLAEAPPAAEAGEGGESAG